jgi:hypothetical protein
VGLLVRPRELNSFDRRQSAIRMAFLPQNLPDSEFDCVKKSALWEHSKHSD